MGKAAILMVLSFSLVLGVVLPTSYRHANDAYQNFIGYNNVSKAHNIATSAANIAADSLFWSKTYAGCSTISFDGGTFWVTVKDTTSSAGMPRKKIYAYGKYSDSTQIVQILLQQGSFAQFAYYSQLEGSINWATGDTVFGRFHTQSTMNISGYPVFWGKVTAKGGTNPKKSTAIFKSDYQSGVDISMPANLDSVTYYANNGGKSYSNDTLWLKLADDSIRYRRTQSGKDTTASIKTFTPNGVLQMTGGDIHVQGRLNGRLTILATKSTKGGKIYIDSSVVFKYNPRTSDTVTSMLGLVAQDSLIVVDNTANQNGCEIDAAIFSLNAGLGAQNYDRSSGTPNVLRGRLTLYGGMTQYQRVAVGTLSGSTIVTGFRKNYTYDNRLMVDFPPHFPLTGSFQIISWLE